MDKHGLSYTAFYHCWDQMKQKCTNEKNKSYPSVGGKGIKFDEKWKEFTGFRDDMYESYLKHVEEFGEKNTTMLRIDKTKDYNKGNIRWATHKEQIVARRSRKDNSSEVPGVTWRKDDHRWQAYIAKDRKMYHLGYFKHKADAVKARKEAELTYFK